MAAKKYRLTINPRIITDGVMYKGEMVKKGEVLEVTKAEAAKMVLRTHKNLPLWVKGEYAAGKAEQEADKAEAEVEAILQTMEEGEE